uniref:Uncharacterized protein n=1 Tax=Arundo donax TaxID=35708 RepID=A0A0A8YVR2_ARUDO
MGCSAEQPTRLYRPCLFFLPVACSCYGTPTDVLYKKSELVQLRICGQHARALCRQPAKILFQEHEISSMVDELLSMNSAGLSEDGIKLVKYRVLENAQGFFETPLTFNKCMY